jgi:integrase
MANLRVSIIEKVKQADGTWTNVTVKIPKSKPGSKGLYLKDRRDGKFYLLWREGKRKVYHPVEGSLSEAIRAKEQKEKYLASIAAGLKVEDPTEGTMRLTVAQGIDGFLETLTGRGNTVASYTQNLRQFEDWNSRHRNRKTYLDQIDRQHILAFRKWLESEVCNDPYTAVWKCIRLNKCIKVMLDLPAGKGPVTKGDFAEVLNRKPTVTIYAKDERDKFLACCIGVSFLLWSLFLTCGLRLKELSHLEWTDIDWTAQVVRVRRKKVQDGEEIVEFTPKKWSVRDVAIPDDLFALLKTHKETTKSHLVFPTRTGRVNTKLWDACKRIARCAGLDASKFMPKNFRSTYATNRLRNGYTLTDVRDQLGHRDMLSVEHYAQALKAEELVRSGAASAGWD